MQPQAPRPFTQPQDYYQLRDFGRKFEATIEFLKVHGRNLYAVLLLALLPFVLGLALQAANGYSSLNHIRSRAGGASTFDTYGKYGTPFWLGMLLVLLASTLLIVMIYSFMKLRMSKEDPSAPITSGEVWQLSRGYLLPIIGYSIVITILVFIGMFLLVLPGIYVAIVFALFPCVLVFEDAGMDKVFSRPFNLIQGKWWSTCGLAVVGSVAAWIVSAVIGGIIGGIVALLMPGPLSLNSTGVAVGDFIQQLVYYAASPVVYVLVAFQYFNLVERRDGVSLQWKIDQLGQAPAAQPAASADDSLFRPSYGDQTY